tara:strand:+ start:287 stop:550 length:264 start_codon:yes stop_codon:yes gene_type:complete
LTGVGLVVREIQKKYSTKILEWFGVLTAIVYSLLVASNTGYETLGFSLLLVSAISIGFWGFLCRHYGILVLQFFYAAAGILGVIRWL